MWAHQSELLAWIGVYDLARRAHMDRLSAHNQILVDVSAISPPFGHLNTIAACGCCYATDDHGISYSRFAEAHPAAQ